MNELLIYTDFVSERLIYTFNFICHDRGVKFEFCNDPKRFELESEKAKLVYSDYPFENIYPTILPAKLIFEDEIQNQVLSLGSFKSEPCLEFHRISDPIASIFYVISRYEEYLPYNPDAHDRFESKNSVLKKYNWLYKPVSDIWSELVLSYVKENCASFVFRHPATNFTLTIDVDNTFAFKHKNAIQLIGGRFKDFIQGNSENQILRRKVLAGELKDPNDTFDQILDYVKHGISVKLFWHLGDFKKNDRNISWTNAVHQRLIQKMSEHITLGIHPSYASYLNELKVKQERGRLEHIIKKPVFHTRQHFLKVRFPATFQLLDNITIKHDYSLGFADDIGFRLGTARPVKFYNLEKEEVTGLTLHPFVYMDGTLNQYLNLSPEEAISKIDGLIQEIKKHGGHFMCIWHNDTINDLGVWEGWKSVLQYTIDQFRDL